MSNIVVIGTQWGDEGKGKIIDLLAGHFDMIARFQGGHNAGHTVYRGNKKYVLSLIPCQSIYTAIKSMFWEEKNNNRSILGKIKLLSVMRNDPTNVVPGIWKNACHN